MSTFDQKTTGLGAVESLQRDLARTRTIDVSVTCKASPGRSAGDNVIILRDQAKKGRNVIFLDKKEQEAGTRLWKASIADITSDRATFRPMVRGGTKVGDLMVDSIPSGRAGEADDVARLVTFLASPAADFINGALIPIDGAMTP